MSASPKKPGVKRTLSSPRAPGGPGGPGGPPASPKKRPTQGSSGSGSLGGNVAIDINTAASASAADDKSNKPAATPSEKNRPPLSELVRDASDDKAVNTAVDYSR